MAEQERKSFIPINFLSPIQSLFDLAETKNIKRVIGGFLITLKDGYKEEYLTMMNHTPLKVRKSKLTELTEYLGLSKPDTETIFINYFSTPGERIDTRQHLELWFEKYTRFGISYVDFHKGSISQYDKKDSSKRTNKTISADEATGYLVFIQEKLASIPENAD